MKKNIEIPSHFTLGPPNPLTIMSGPCVIESLDHALETAHSLKEMFHQEGINLIYKSSFDKANRSSIHSFRGPGLEEGLKILEEVKKRYHLPVVTDIHYPEQAKPASTVCDILQIPAFLCRQTDLLTAAGETDAIISVKKGQFMSPWEMENVLEKVTSAGNQKVILTDRGTSFGYNNLITDIRAIPIMQKFAPLVCFDASHSIQLPGGMGATSGGQTEFIPYLAKAAIAAGVDLLFIESHPHPEKAKSDAKTVMGFDQLQPLLKQLKKIYECVNL